MNAEIFAEWLRRQGHRVVRTESSYWYDAGTRVYQAFPYHWLIQPSEAELTEFLHRKGAIGLRYSAPVESPVGQISYHVVCENPQYRMDLLDRRTRQNVRNGLNQCRVEQVPLSRLADEGWQLEIDTVDRQGRHVKVDKESWSRRYRAASDLPGFEAWGALVGDRLVASILMFRMDDWCEMISQQCHRDFLPLRVNNAMAFTVTQAVVQRPGISSLFYALHSLDAPPSMDDFKFRMGYTARPVRQRVVFHPWLTGAIGPTTYAAARKLLQLYPGIRILPKLTGMLRFYLDGMRPLDQQEWPKCLVSGGAATAGTWPQVPAPTVPV